jgi:hypothetical protein
VELKRDKEVTWGWMERGGDWIKVSVECESLGRKLIVIWSHVFESYYFERCTWVQFRSVKLNVAKETWGWMLLGKHNVEKASWSSKLSKAQIIQKIPLSV